MPLPRTLLGLVTLVGATAPAVAQPPAAWPAPKGPNRIVYPVPPWITGGARTGPLPAMPGSPPAAGAPQVSEVRFVAPGTQQAAATDTPSVPVAPAPRPVTPQVVPAAAVGPVAPPAVRTAAPSTTARPDVWAPQAPRTLPGTTVPAPKGR